MPSTITEAGAERAPWPPPRPPSGPLSGSDTPVSTPAREPGLDRSDIRPRPLPGRPLWVLFGSLLILGGALWGTFSAVSLLAHEEWTVTHTQPAAGITTLRVDSESGSVEVRGADTDEITVVAEVSRGLFDTDESVTVVGDVYEVRSSCPALSSQWCWVNYEITVPRDLDVAIDTDGGRITVTGVDGDVEVDSDDGRIELVGLAGVVRARSDNGSIVATDLTSSTVDAAADNGRIELWFADPPDAVTAQADNGSVVIAVPPVDGDYSVTTRTDNGSTRVDITDDPTSSRTIDVTTDNGSVTVQPTP